MSEGSRPRVVSSVRQIKYRQSRWHVHQFKILSGDVVCQVAVLRMEGSLMLWLGCGEPELSEMALGTVLHNSKNGGHGGLATTLLGPEGSATAMARRLGALLKRPVFVCTAGDFDRLTIPVVERGLISEIKSRPHCFYSEEQNKKYK